MKKIVAVLALALTINLVGCEDEKAKPTASGAVEGPEEGGGPSAPPPPPPPPLPGQGS